MTKPLLVAANFSPSSTASGSLAAGTSGTAVPKIEHGHATVNDRVATAPMFALSSTARTRTGVDPVPDCT